MTVKVSEFVYREQDGGIEIVARFVWPGHGPVKVVGLAEGELDAALKRIGRGVVGTDGVARRLEDGEGFLDALPHEFRGSYFWASRVRVEPDERLSGLLDGVELYDPAEAR